MVSMSVDLHHGSPKLALSDRLCAFFYVWDHPKTKNKKLNIFLIILDILHSSILLLLFAISTTSAQLISHMNNL